MGPEFLVSFTVSSFSIVDILFKRNTYGDKNVLRFGQGLGSIETKGPQTGTAYHAILTGLKSSNNLRWLTLLIKIGANQFWWAPRL